MVGVSCRTPLRSSSLREPLVEAVYPRKKDTLRGFLDAIVGDTERQVESKRVEQVVASSSVEQDLRQALEVCLLEITLVKSPT